MHAMHALITGINGFVGGYLAEHLLHTGTAQVSGISRASKLVLAPLAPHVAVLPADLRDEQQTLAAIQQAAPDVIIHLAGQTFVPESFRDPAGTLQTNILGTLHVLQAMRALDKPCRLLITGSNEEYGMITPADLPLNEDTPLRPASPYGVSKASQTLLGLQYHRSFGTDVVIMRPFNHIGPRQSDRFVTGAFAHQIARIERGLQEPVLKVGNLTGQRDFTDVRDIVAAYALAIEHAPPGAVYNLGSGQPRSIRSLLDLLAAASTTSFRIEPDPERMRPVNIPLVVCDAARFRERTGWEPRIPIEQTMRDILADWRERVRKEE